MRIRRFPLFLLPALCAAGAFATACTDEPLPQDTQSGEERRLAPLVGRHGNPFVASAGNDTSSQWEGKWQLNGHILALEQTHLPAGQVGSRIDLFGYSVSAKRFFMIDVKSGGTASDSVGVKWFVINGNQWRFLPTEDTVAGKATVRGLVWDTKTPAATIVSADSVDPPPPPHPRAEMGLFKYWPGKWPNKHTESGVDVDGTFDSKLIGNGNFLVWFQNNVLTDTSKKVFRERQVSVWGFSDVTHRFYRVDIAMLVNQPITPRIIFTPWFITDEENKGLMLVSPLLKQQVGSERLPTRYAIGMSPVNSDTLIVIQQYLYGGVTWTNMPGGMAKWARIR